MTAVERNLPATRNRVTDVLCIRRLPVDSPAVNALCPTEDLLVGLVEGRLDSSVAARLHNHIRDCSDCRLVLAGPGAPPTPPLSGPPPGPPPLSGPPLAAR